MKKPKQYIIVDDDRTNNLICEYAVKGYDPDADVMTFNEPEIALSTIRNKILKEDGCASMVLFVDVNMPTMSGWEFLKELEKLEEEVIQRFTIFILSSSIEDFKDERINFPYVTDFLSKPLSKTRLKELQL
ncbi:response regulator [Salinimicrobium terrae]|uniref:response regulator n=1 Tax=Salinimicrobium terrae TaxID=470866 RepID=UPI0003F96309|nr:response regulator [Salinimicrobium terrae]